MIDIQAESSGEYIPTNLWIKNPPTCFGTSKHYVFRQERMHNHLTNKSKKNMIMMTTNAFQGKIMQPYVFHIPHTSTTITHYTNVVMEKTLADPTFVLARTITTPTDWQAEKKHK